MEDRTTRRLKDMAKVRKLTNEDKSTIGKVLRYIKKYYVFLIISILLAAVTVACTLYVPILTGNAIDLIINEGMVDFDGILSIIKTMIAVIIIGAIAQWLMNVSNNKITYNVIRDIRTEAIRKLEILPLKYIDGHPYGDVVSRVIADVDQFADGLLMGFTQLFTGVITILGTLGFMLTINIPITIVVVCVTPLSLFVAAYIAKNTHEMFKKQSETRGEQTAIIDEMVGNLKVVKAYSQEDEVKEKFDEVNDRLEKCSLKAIFFSSITNPSTRFVNSIVYMLVALVGAISAVHGRISIGRLSSMLSYANQYTKPFNEISGVVTELQNALTCAGRVMELIEEEPQVPEPENAGTVNADGHVELENVYFSYVPDQKLIEDFNLSVKPGQRIAIVGPTGCGKTTLINLLMRFYDVNSGSIKVAGDDIRDVTRGSLRRSYGMVLQDTWLKNGTIRENLKMGKPDATEEEMIAAAKASHAHSFIKRLPQGYDTVLNEDGGSLSQGQKQLLCIASFIVAHRLSTIREADVILVMKDGHIIEQGNHDTLLAKGGFYSQLYNSQF